MNPASMDGLMADQMAKNLSYTLFTRAIPCSLVVLTFGSIYMEIVIRKASREANKAFFPITFYTSVYKIHEKNII